MGQVAGAAVAAVSRLPGPRHGCNDARGRVNLTNCGVEPIYDVDVTISVHAYGIDLIDGRLRCLATVAGIALGSSASDRGDNAGGSVNAAEGVTLGLTEEHVALLVEVAHEGVVNQRPFRRSAVAAMPCLAGPGDGLDDALNDVHNGSI